MSFFTISRIIKRLVFLPSPLDNSTAEGKKANFNCTDKSPSKNTVEDRAIYIDAALRLIATRRRRKKSRRRRAWNPQPVAVCDQLAELYGIKPQNKCTIRASRNAIRNFVAIPYNAQAR